ncbi:MAG: 50S ribosomal protein L9, partial [Gammaproteobacteria bacterium]|nr:50S ribosomal protein L9 [Gammaproteobacteria bacterium]
MEVILLEKIVKLGNLGDKVNVKAGYGRNYLVPKNKAVPATRENLERFETRKAELEQAAREKLDSARQRAAKLGELKLSLTAQAGEEGKLFGSIGVRDITDAVKAQGLELEKSEVRMPEGPIRTVGEFEITV